MTPMRSASIEPASTARSGTSTPGSSETASSSVMSAVVSPRRSIAICSLDGSVPAIESTAVLPEWSTAATTNPWLASSSVKKDAT